MLAYEVRVFGKYFVKVTAFLYFDLKKRKNPTQI